MNDPAKPPLFKPINSLSISLNHGSTVEINTQATPNRCVRGEDWRTGDRWLGLLEVSKGSWLMI